MSRKTAAATAARPKSRITTEIPEDVWKKLWDEKLRTRRTVGEITADALTEYLKRRTH